MCAGSEVELLLAVGLGVLPGGGAGTAPGASSGVLTLEVALLLAAPDDGRQRLVAKCLVLSPLFPPLFLSPLQFHQGRIP
jgi:hypothetical protein